MEAQLVQYAIWAVLAISGAGILAILLFGVRSLMYGKVNPVTAGLMLVPAILLVVLGFVMDSWAEAGIWTLIIMFALGVLALLLSGVRGLFA